MCLWHIRLHGVAIGCANTRRFIVYNLIRNAECGMRNYSAKLKETSWFLLIRNSECGMRNYS